MAPKIGVPVEHIENRILLIRSRDEGAGPIAICDWFLETPGSVLCLLSFHGTRHHHGRHGAQLPSRH